MEEKRERGASGNGAVSDSNVRTGFSFPDEYEFE